jgi:hypothetical protein
MELTDFPTSADADDNSFGGSNSSAALDAQESGWDLLLKMIKNRGQDSRSWRIVKRIKEVRRMYYNLIKKSTQMN